MQPYGSTFVQSPVPSPLGFLSHNITFLFSLIHMLLDDGDSCLVESRRGLENSPSQTFSDMHDDEVCCGVAPKPL